MTRRERLERKLELRQEWAEKARERAASRWEASNRATDGIPFGQPILVGHHSERHHLRAIEKAQNNATKSCEESALAKHHAGAAIGLEHALDSSIYSDDSDAVAALTARLAEREAERATDTSPLCPPTTSSAPPQRTNQ